MVSHPCDKNKDVAWMGHGVFGGNERKADWVPWFPRSQNRDLGTWLQFDCGDRSVGRLRSAAAGDQVKDQDDDRYHDEDVDEPAADVKSETRSHRIRRTTKIVQSIDAPHRFAWARNSKAISGCSRSSE